MNKFRKSKLIIDDRKKSIKDFKLARDEVVHWHVLHNWDKKKRDRFVYLSTKLMVRRGGFNSPNPFKAGDLYRAAIVVNNKLMKYWPANTKKL